MADGVVIRWWADRGRALVFYAFGFAAGLLVLAFRTGQFEAIHRVIMGTCGVACAYFAVVRITNATSLRVVGKRLVVSHGPLPWRRSLSVSLSQIEDLSIDRAASRLQLLTAQGEEVALVDDIQSRSTARLDDQLNELMSQGAGRDEG